MTKPKFAPTDPTAALAALAQDQTKKTKAALFRKHFESIENAIKSGASHEQVTAVLKAHGIEFSPGAFSAYLNRERKRRNTAPLAQMSPNRIPAGREMKRPEVQGDVDRDADVLSSSDPGTLDAIINSTPNLDALAKRYKNSQKKVNS